MLAEGSWVRALVLSAVIHCVLFAAVAGFIRLWPAADDQPIVEIELIAEVNAPEPQADNAGPFQATPAAYRAAGEIAPPVSASESSSPAFAQEDMGQQLSRTGDAGGTDVRGASGPASASSGGTDRKPRRLSPPRILSRVEPQYPEKARRDGVEGTVGIKVEIMTNGLAGRVWVESSSGSELLDQAALQAVREFRFVPARDEASGSPVVSVTFLPIAFQLR
jgi:periplasmic protein TonB